MLKRLGFADKERVWEWVNKYEEDMCIERWNGKENRSGRKDLWFGVGVNLGFTNELFMGKEIDKGLRLVGNKWWGGDDWNSVLLLKYSEGVELNPHVDRDLFDNKVVIVNISEDGLFGGNIEFIYKEQIEVLSNG